MNRYLPFVPVLGIFTTVALTSPSVLALDSAEVKEIVKEYTVQLEGKHDTGTGTIIGKTGNRYTVLTCQHVFKGAGNFQLKTADGKTHDVVAVRSLDSFKIDLAIAYFVSKENYDIAELGSSEDLAESIDGYVAGYPDPIYKIPERSYFFEETMIISNLETGENGYRIVHNTPTTDGASGGGIFDLDGYLVGVNGRTISDEFGRAHRGLAIPIEIYLNKQESFTVLKTVTRTPGAVTTGREKLERKDYRGAISQFVRALELDEGDFDALQGRGEAYYGLKDFSAAVDNFDAAVAADGSNARLYFYRGSAYSQLDRTQEAISDYTTAVNLDPDYIEAYYQRALKHQELSKDVQVIANFNQVILLDSNAVNAYIGRGKAYFNLEEYQRAISDYDRAIQIDSQAAEAYYNRGLVYHMMGQEQQAIADYNRAVSLNSQYANNYYNWAYELYK